MALDGSYLHDHTSQLDATDASIRHDNSCVNVEIPSAEQSIIVHEQSQPPWFPSPNRLGLCSYKDNEAEARVPPLARAEEDSLAPFGIGEKAHGHM